MNTGTKTQIKATKIALEFGAFMPKPGLNDVFKDTAKEAEPREHTVTYELALLEEAQLSVTDEYLSLVRDLEPIIIQQVSAKVDGATSPEPMRCKTAQRTHDQVLALRSLSYYIQGLRASLNL